MKWKMPKTYHDFMESYKELVWPTKKEKKEEPKKEIKISSADE
tara:strand:- start:360 stop:488 length:129 start_codon:yes stop_codon:yes gene_type:complete